MGRRFRGRRHPDLRESETEQPLGDSLETFLRESGLRFMLKHPELHTVWEEVVGPEIAAHTRVSAFRGGTFEVAVDSSTLMHEIQFHRAALLQDLRERIRRPFIARIRFVVRPEKENDVEDGVGE